MLYFEQRHCQVIMLSWVTMASSSTGLQTGAAMHVNLVVAAPCVVDEGGHWCGDCVGGSLRL